ncbi:MAG: ferredoxin [Parcubacteria group bacterium]|nr:ferredoxin [Parcubacteria group bacterium]
MATIKIDEEKCIGCGTCAAMVPDVFEMNEANKAEVVDSEGDTLENINMAASACPVQAIEVQ